MYRPAKLSILIDLMILLLSLVVVFELFPLTTVTPYQKYDQASLLYFILWIVVSFLIGRYKPLHLQKYKKATLNLVYVTILMFLISWTISFLVYNSSYSIYVIFTFTTVVFVINFVFYLLNFALLYAVDYDEPLENTADIRQNATLKEAIPLDSESYIELSEAISQHSGAKVLSKLSENFDLKSGNTLVNFSSNYLSIKSKRNYQYSTIIQLETLNNSRAINALLAVANSKLPDDGRFVCCFESKSTRKRRILSKYPPVLNYFIYSVHFVFKRILPKVFLTRRLYYDITKGKNRILTKAEVMGRLYFSGFEVMQEFKVGKLNFVLARRLKQPEPLLKKTYGPMIKLRRMGKNRQLIEVYKMRTMHPYAEYLQAYIYNRNSLKEGGKFNKDIRVTTMGSIMRKYWLDELPMILNLLNGEMKIVGVRPLSNQYFNLYSTELQEKRVKFKPGLLPPFYADMPKTMDEIQNSEMQYLCECEAKGTFRTDTRYFFLILKNIFFKKARSG